MVYAFGEIELDERTFELRRGGALVHAQPKVLDLLFLLARTGDRVLLKEEIQRRLWPNVNVSDSSITRLVVEARRLIGDDAQKLIVTVRARGFRLAMPVAERSSVVPPQPPPPNKAPPVAPTLIGRAACLSAAAAALERARTGAGSLVWLSGERGVGRSSVLAEIGRRADTGGATVRVAHARRGMEAPPFWLWREALPELDAAFPILGTGPSPAGAARFSLLDGIARHLADMATRNVLVLLFDDLHWADPDSLQLLEFVAPTAGRAKLVVVSTYWSAGLKSDEEAQAVVGAMGHPDSVVLPLRPLSLDELGQLVENATGSLPSEAFVNAMYERSGGNPLYALRILATDWAQKARSGAGEQATTMDLPQDVIATVAAHLREISPQALELLTQAAVLGLHLDLAKLSVVSGSSVGDLLSLLDEAVRGQVLRRDRRGNLHFSHRLVRDVLYKRLPGADRARRHAAAGRALLAHYGKAHERHLEELADHFGLALPEGDVERAIDLSVRAAEEAAAAGRHLEAARYWQQASRALSMVPGGDPRQLKVATGLAHAWQGAGREREAREALLDVEALERTLGTSR